MATKQSNIQSLTLTNRFQALPVEEVNQENVNAHTSDIPSTKNDFNQPQSKACVNNTSIIHSNCHKNGFPLDFNRDAKIISADANHTEHEQHIDQYIAKELKYGALYGPFEHTPIPVHVSPLMTRAKQNSDKRRTFVDLRWPKKCFS